MTDHLPFNLRGYSLPFTPEGRASLVTETPHHYGGQFLFVEFRADVASGRSSGRCWISGRRRTAPFPGRRC